MMNRIIGKGLDNKIKGSMLLSLLNRTNNLGVISNSTYLELKNSILAEYKLNLD